MTKRTRRRLRLAGGSAPPPPAEPVGELVRCDLVTFGAASLHALSTVPELLDIIAPSWGTPPPPLVILDASELTPF